MSKNRCYISMPARFGAISHFRPVQTRFWLAGNFEEFVTLQLVLSLLTSRRVSVVGHFSERKECRNNNIW